MKTFLIPYKYVRAGSVEVRANSLEEAKELALEASAHNDPRNEYYIADSFEVDDEFSHEVKEDSTESVWSFRYNNRFDIINSSLCEVRLASEYEPHSPPQA